jgi:hypothetical protein
VLPVNDVLKGSAFGFLKQACMELSEAKEFDSEKDFKKWVTDSMQPIIQRASELNAEMLNKISMPDGAKVKKLIAAKVWESVMVGDVRQRARDEYKAILRN